MDAGDHHPLAHLPQTVIDGHILPRLSDAELACASLACRAWRRWPTRALLELTGPQPSSSRTHGILSSLHHCCNLRVIRVASSTDPAFPQLLDALLAAAQQGALPRLRALHIQHSSRADGSTHSAAVQRLVRVLEAQGPACQLHLALTDSASLQALLPLLPLPSLAELQLNVPYLADGMSQLLVEAAIKQTAAQPCSQHEQQRVLRVSLWVCCWGGCPGLALPDALSLHARLAALRPRVCMVGCEAVKVGAAPGDMAALARLTGLEALGLVFEGQQQQSDAVPGNADADADADAAGNDGTSSAANALAASLRACAGTLRELTLRGSPAGGWAHKPAAGQHLLAALTGLTKLSLLKERSPRPLPLQPLSALQQLRQLAIERVRLCARDELTSLSALTALTALSLELSVQADELLEEAAQQQAAEAASSVDAPGQALAAGMQQLRLSGGDGAGGRSDVCVCCCSSVDAAGAAPAAPPLTAAQLCDKVAACPRFIGSQPDLIDWRWMRHMGRLVTAILQVPHLDLSCLPPSLVELDAQQPHDSSRVSITVAAGGGAINLPHLQSLVLPRPLQPADEADDDSSSSSGFDTSRLDADSPDSVQQQHYATWLLANVVRGSPRLRTLELVQWRPAAAAVLSAAVECRFLNKLSVVPDQPVAQLTRAIAECSRRPSRRPLQLDPQELLVLSSYPWSRVLASR